MADSDKRSPIARALLFTFINLTVAAVIAAIAIGTFYGIQALYHLAGGR